MPRPLQVLFLCTHNSARSLLAEALLNHLADERFQAYSAGSSPREHQQPHPLAIDALQRHGIATAGLRSKSWDEFGTPNAPRMDLVITVCDNAAGEACPFWPGQPATAHWGFPDPSVVQGSAEEQQAAFSEVLHAIRARVERLVNLPVAATSPRTLQQSVRELIED